MPARYFAMIDGEMVGPLTLQELPGAGVRPDTYVWCKRMDDWRRARSVADICRLYRRRLAGISEEEPQRHPQNPAAAAESAPDITARIRNPRFLPPAAEPVNPDTPPRSRLTESILVTLLCFPFTGPVAIYFSILARKCWERAEQARASGNDADYRRWRDESWDATRKARMWIGISFFLGFILISFLGRYISV